MKGGSGTRPWRSYFIIHDSLKASFEQLNTILHQRNEQHRLFNINPILLNQIVELMRPFSLIFDKLEMANERTLQNVVPSYYRMMKDVQADHKVIDELKSEIRLCLDEKFLPSILQIHWVATYLDPSFRSLFFVSDRSYLETQRKEIRKGLHILASDLIDNLDGSSTSQLHSGYSPPPKRLRDDPFADFRNQATSKDPLISGKKALTIELDRQIQMYENMDNEHDYDKNPYSFWFKHKHDLSLLAKISLSVLVIPASSAESERHYGWVRVSVGVGRNISQGGWGWGWVSVPYMP